MVGGARAIDKGKGMCKSEVMVKTKGKGTVEEDVGEGEVNGKATAKLEGATIGLAITRTEDSKVSLTPKQAFHLGRPAHYNATMSSLLLPIRPLLPPLSHTLDKDALGAPALL